MDSHVLRTLKIVQQLHVAPHFLHLTGTEALQDIEGTQSGVQLPGRQRHHKVSHLSLSMGRVDGKCLNGAIRPICSICDALRDNKTVRILRLGDNQIKAEGTHAIARKSLFRADRGPNSRAHSINVSLTGGRIVFWRGCTTYVIWHIVVLSRGAVGQLDADAPGPRAERNRHGMQSNGFGTASQPDAGGEYIA